QRHEEHRDQQRMSLCSSCLCGLLDLPLCYDSVQLCGAPRSAEDSFQPLLVVVDALARSHLVEIGGTVGALGPFAISAGAALDYLLRGTSGPSEWIVLHRNG